MHACVYIVEDTCQQAVPEAQSFMLRDWSYVLGDATPIEDPIIVHISANELSNKEV